MFGQECDIENQPNPTQTVIRISDSLHVIYLAGRFIFSSLKRAPSYKPRPRRRFECQCSARQGPSRPRSGSATEPSNRSHSVWTFSAKKSKTERKGKESFEMMYCKKYIYLFCSLNVSLRLWRWIFVIHGIGNYVFHFERPYLSLLDVTIFTSTRLNQLQSSKFNLENRNVRIRGVRREVMVSSGTDKNQSQEIYNAYLRDWVEFALIASILYAHCPSIRQVCRPHFALGRANVERLKWMGVFCNQETARVKGIWNKHQQ